MTVRDIDGVLQALDAAVARARDERSPIGYFAALYRSVTQRVRDGLGTGLFDDDDRLERLDVVFASRYLDAVRAHQLAGRTTRSWAAAFAAAEDRGTIVLQHLLVGINAHINLDLGIAAATVAPGDTLPSLRRDFDLVNEVLASAMHRARADLAEISPWLGLLDTFGGRADDELVRFSITVARAQAWHFAVELAPLAPDAWDGAIELRDRRTAALAARVLRPGPLGVGIGLVRLRESRDVRRNLDVLARPTSSSGPDPSRAPRPGV